VCNRSRIWAGTLVSVWRRVELLENWTYIAPHLPLFGASCAFWAGDAMPGAVVGMRWPPLYCGRIGQFANGPDRRAHKAGKDTAQGARVLRR